MRVVCCLFCCWPASPPSPRASSVACSITQCRGSPWWRSAARRRPRPPAIRASRCWWCVKRASAGLPSSASPQEPARPHQLQVSDGRTLGFTVGTKHYREQHIKLKNSRQVNPLAEDMTRINRELAEQTRAYQTFSPTQPSNLLFDKPVDGPLSSPFGLRRFFNGEERNPTPASTSRSVPALHQVAGGGQSDPDRQLLLQRQYGVRRSRSGPHQHVLPHVEGRRDAGPEPAPRRYRRPGRRHRPCHRSPCTGMSASTTPASIPPSSSAPSSPEPLTCQGRSNEKRQPGLPFS